MCVCVTRGDAPAVGGGCHGNREEERRMDPPSRITTLNAAASHIYRVWMMRE